MASTTTQSRLAARMRACALATFAAAALLGASACGQTDPLHLMPSTTGPSIDMTGQNAGGGYTIETLRQPVATQARRWDPCAGPIAFKVNPAGLVRADLTGLSEAFTTAAALVSKASGLTFVNKGFTDFIPDSRWKENFPSGIAMVIVFVGPAQYEAVSEVYTPERGSVGTSLFDQAVWKVTPTRPVGFVDGRDKKLKAVRFGAQSKFLDFWDVKELRDRYGTNAVMSPGFGAGLSYGSFALASLTNSAGLQYQQFTPKSAVYRTWGDDRQPAKLYDGDRKGLAAVGAAAGCNPQAATRIHY